MVRVHGYGLIVGTWIAQGVVAAMAATGIAAMLHWVRQVNRRLARIEHRMRLRSHRR